MAPLKCGSWGKGVVWLVFIHCSGRSIYKLCRAVSLIWKTIRFYTLRCFICGRKVLHISRKIRFQIRTNAQANVEKSTIESNLMLIHYALVQIRYWSYLDHLVQQKIFQKSTSFLLTVSFRLELWNFQIIIIIKSKLEPSRLAMMFLGPLHLFVEIKDVSSPSTSSFLIKLFKCVKC